FKFTWGKEGKDERGQKILNKAYISSAPIMPIGWLLLEIAHDFSGISYEFYRDSMWVLVLLTFRSEEHTSELQSRFDLVCRLLIIACTVDLYTLCLHDALPIF